MYIFQQHTQKTRIRTKNSSYFYFTSNEIENKNECANLTLRAE